jgi:hypothetical protein
MKAPRIAPLPKWKVDLVEEAIKLIEEEVGGPVTGEIIGRRIFDARDGGRYHVPGAGSLSPTCKVRSK